jgi:hypothetical protein
MINKEPEHNLSAIILSFKSWNKPWQFEEYVLQNIKDLNEILFFKEIWSQAIEFENWNSSDLSIGIQTTTLMLEKKFELDNNVAFQIAKAASYNWK